MRLAGCKAVITGAARGIGRAIAHAFAQEGCDLAVNALHEEGLRALVQELEGLGVSVLPLPGDVSDHGLAREHAATVQRAFGRVDYLVNNAGVSQPKLVADLSEEEWDRTLAINLKSGFNWTQAFLPLLMAAPAPAVVNISSISAKHGGGFGTVSKACYAASKAGVLGFTRGLAKELAPKVRVNAVCPGLIATPMTARLVESPQAPEILKTIPLGRFGRPEEVAAVVLFLCLPEASYITGEVVDVNGGMLID
ncbi:MAG: glucose 1-dehydrogenase [Bacillota bacterium]